MNSHGHERAYLGVWGYNERMHTCGSLYYNQMTWRLKYFIHDYGRQNEGETMNLHLHSQMFGKISKLKELEKKDTNFYKKLKNILKFILRS
jgi:hypothetical protein